MPSFKNIENRSCALTFLFILCFLFSLHSQSPGGYSTGIRFWIKSNANVYSDARVGQYAQALDYYRQVGAQHLAAGNERELATNWFNIGSTLQITGEFAAAEGAFRKALAGYAELDDKRSLAQTQRARDQFPRPRTFSTIRRHVVHIAVPPLL